jgi:hypothetical protein
MAGSGGRVAAGKNKKFFFLAACAVAFAAGVARAEDLPPLALIALQAPQVEAGQQRALAQRLRQRLAASHRFALVSRELTELQLSQAVFEEDGQCRGSCIDRARDVAGVSLLMSGRIDRAEGRCTVRLELTDVINEASSQRSETAGPCAAPGLQKTLDAALDRLLLRGGETPPAVAAAPAPPAVSGFASASATPSRSRARIAVQAAERGVTADALTGVRRALMEKGLQVVDGRKAQYLIRIRATVSSAPGFGDSTLLPRLATVSYELVRAGGDAMIGTGTKTGRMAHIDPNQGAALALLAAGREVADEVSQLLEAEAAR